MKAMSLLSWTVGAQAQLETPAHLERLLDSPAQVEEELQLCSVSNSLYSLTDDSLGSVQNLSGWWEVPVAVQELWR